MLEAREVAKLSAMSTCDFSEQARESGAWLPTSLGLS